ncbi:MAG: VPS10 domain-containing protein [bacterium]
MILTGGRGPSTQTNWSFVVSYSTNGGTNWTRCNLSGLTSGFCYALTFAPSQTDIVYAGGEVAGSGAIYRSTNSGLDWSRTSGSPRDTVYALTVHPLDPNRVYAATTGGVYLTTDGGINWTLLPAQRRLRAVKISPAGTDTIWVGGDSGVMVSKNGGATWQPMNHGLGCTLITSLEFALSPELRLLAGTNGGAGYSWSFPTGMAEFVPGEPVPPFIASNPVRGYVRIKIGATGGRVRIYDILGRTVAEILNTGTMVVVDVTGLPAGCYQVEVNTDRQRTRTRLVISR